jgi:hypothetical protein
LYKQYQCAKQIKQWLKERNNEYQEINNELQEHQFTSFAD